MGVDVRMYAVTNEPLTLDKLRELSWRMCEAVYHSNFWLEAKSGSFALSLADDWEVDEYGVDTSYKQVIKVNQLWRYYGPGYERGEWPVIAATIEWLKRNGFRVYYGGDSGGYCFEMTTEEMDKLWAHFAKHGHHPYHGRSLDSNDPEATCVYCKMPMNPYAWGGYRSSISYACPGCGYHCTTSDGGKTFVELKVGSNY